MARKTDTKTTEASESRTTHRWTPQELETAISLIGVPREEAWERFAKAHPETASVISRQALQGRIYGLRKHASTAPEWRRKALEAELANARAEVARIEQELADLEQQLTALDVQASGTEADNGSTRDELSKLSYRELQAAAKARGLKASGGRESIIERIVTA